MLSEIACPHCGALELTAQDPTGLVVCTKCGLKYGTNDPLACPNCEAINSKLAATCKACGTALKLKCPSCDADNWAGASYCIRCNASFDKVEALAQRHAQGFRGTWEEQRRQAKALKVKEAIASEKRLAQMWGTDTQRQTELAEQQAKQKAQQNQLLFFATVGLLIFVILAIVIVIVVLPK